jgi:hypothetical protein
LSLSGLLKRVAATVTIPVSVTYNGKKVYTVSWVSWVIKPKKLKKLFIENEIRYLSLNRDSRNCVNSINLIT